MNLPITRSSDVVVRDGEIHVADVEFISCQSGSCADGDPQPAVAFVWSGGPGHFTPVCQGHLEGWYMDCDDFITMPVVEIGAFIDVKDNPSHESRR